jgi:hypothetical protein
MPIQASSHIHSNLNSISIKVCFDYCRFRRGTLKGCPKCIFAQQELRNKNENSGEENLLHPSRPTQVLKPTNMVAPSSSNKLPPTINRPNPQSQFGVIQHQQMQQEHYTTDASATPDWNRLCEQLCRNSSGGLLCKCDLAPF